MIYKNYKKKIYQLKNRIEQMLSRNDFLYIILCTNLVPHPYISTSNHLYFFLKIDFITSNLKNNLKNFL